MPASIIFAQGATTTPAGKASIVQRNQAVICKNATTAASYLWTMLDVPIRSQLQRGLVGTGATFSFTPDVRGTYLVSLKVNNSPLAADNTTSFCAVLSSGAMALGWRYRAAGEASEDNVTTRDLSGQSLGFAGNINTRGWATQDDIEREQTEEAVWRVRNATASAAPGTDALVKVDMTTGKLDSSLIPGTTVFKKATGPLSGHKVVRYTDPEHVALASAADVSHAHNIAGITQTAASAANEDVEIVRSGELEDPSWSFPPFSVLYVDENGNLTATYNSRWQFVRIIGMALSANKVVINMQPPIIQT
jgi:hypothetical protein